MTIEIDFFWIFFTKWRLKSIFSEFFSRKRRLQSVFFEFFTETGDWNRFFLNFLHEMMIEIDFFWVFHRNGRLKSIFSCHFVAFCGLWLRAIVLHCPTESVFVVLAVGVSLECVCAALFQLPLPLADPIRVELVLAAQLGQRLVLLHRIQGDLRRELRRVLAATDFLRFVHLFWILCIQALVWIFGGIILLLVNFFQGKTRSYYFNARITWTANRLDINRLSHTQFFFKKYWWTVVNEKIICNFAASFPFGFRLTDFTKFRRAWNNKNRSPL